MIFYLTSENMKKKKKTKQVSRKETTKFDQYRSSHCRLTFDEGKEKSTNSTQSLDTLTSKV